MTKIQFVPLIPLMLEGKTDHVITLINKGNFNPEETSENGRNLLCVSLILNQLSIAETLVKFANSNDTNFNLENTDIIEQVINDKELLIQTSRFIKKNNLLLGEFKFTYLGWIANNSEHLSNPDYFMAFKNLCLDNLDSIKKLDPFQTIMELGFIGNKKLIELYYNICEFNTLPIQQNPFFGLLKQVCLNAPQYFDYHSCSLPAKKTDWQINIDAMTALDKMFDTLVKPELFRQFVISFQLTKCLSKPPNTHTRAIRPVDQFNKYLETHQLGETIAIVAKKAIMYDKNLFTKEFLLEWPLLYFKNKSYIQDHFYERQWALTLTQAENKLVTAAVEKYNLLGFGFAKNISVEKALGILEEFVLDVKKVFPIQGDNLGNGQLWINLCSESQHNRLASGLIQGAVSFTDSDNMLLTIKYSEYNHEDTISTLLHEYTHFMQFNNPNSAEIALSDLTQEAFKWAEFSKVDFASVLLYEISKGLIWAQELVEENQPQLVATMSNLLEHPIENFKPSCQHRFKSINEDISELIQNSIDHIFYMVEIYYKNQECKKSSYEHQLWDYYDKKFPKGYDRNYWKKPVEIHARLNQDLLRLINGKEAFSVNPKKLNCMKDMIQSYNQLYVDNFNNHINSSQNKLKM